MELKDIFQLQELLNKMELLKGKKKIVQEASKTYVE
jgi:hypothetical protein